MKRILTLTGLLALGLITGCASPSGRPSQLLRVLPGGNSYIAHYDVEQARGEWASAAAANVAAPAAGVDLLQMWEAYQEKDGSRMWALLADGLVTGAWGFGLVELSDNLNSSSGSGSKTSQNQKEAANSLNSIAAIRANQDRNYIKGDDNVVTDVPQEKTFFFEGDRNTIDFQRAE